MLTLPQLIPNSSQLKVLHAYVILFSGVADAVVYAVVARVVDDFLFTTTLSISWESVFCYVVLLLIVLLSLLIHQMDPHHLMNNKLGARGFSNHNLIMASSPMTVHNSLRYYSFYSNENQYRQ